MMGIYDELAVRPFINATGRNFTRFGGSIMRQEVLAAMAEASRQFVNIFELQDRVGRRIAEMTRNEAAFVSCGAASGILLAVATCIAGTDEQRADRLPDSTGLRNRVIMHRCDRGTEADPAIRAAGGKIIDVGTLDGATESQLAEALDENDPAAVVLLAGEHPGKVRTTRIVELAHGRRIPVLIDGATDVPPRENLWRYTRQIGCDAFIVSGGKAIRGPQSTGLVLGTRAIIEGCTFHSSPNLRIGRGMKVGKEEFAGIYTALKLFLAEDETEPTDRARRQISRIAEMLQGIAGVRVHIVQDGTQLAIDYKPTGQPVPTEWVERAMLSGDPSILLRARGNRITVSATLLQPGEEQVVAERLHRVLSEGKPGSDS